MQVDGVEVVVEGRGPRTLLFIHGWPDTRELWTPQVQALQDRWRCVRFTLPGFDLAQPPRDFSLDEVLATIHRIVEATCPGGERVTLVLHDWGCFYGYQYATRQPQRVARVVGVDIGDAGSRRNLAAMSLKQKLMVLGYQLWLATASRIGSALGDRMARAMARWFRVPAPPQAIGAQMGYPYAVQWFKVKGGFDTPRAFVPTVPMLFFYGERKPFMFHSQAWRDKIAARPHGRVIGLPTGHWVMVQAPEAFNAALRQWLIETDGVAATEASDALADAASGAASAA